MDIRAATGEPADAFRELGVVHTRGGIDDQTLAIEREPHELALWCGRPASCAGAHGNMGTQDDTSESQLIAR